MTIQRRAAVTETRKAYTLKPGDKVLAQDCGFLTVASVSMGFYRKTVFIEFSEDTNPPSVVLPRNSLVEVMVAP